MIYGANGSTSLWAKDHTRAAIDAVRSEEQHFQTTLPEQGKMLEEQTFVSSYELTNRSKAEAPHLVLVRSGIRQSFWSCNHQPIYFAFQPPRAKFAFCKMFPIIESDGTKQNTHLYLRIRNLRI
jgi:hypothetical protein